ncbi:MAG: GlxA family transcriptional regulator [Acetobacter sp.]|uniref:GlxA family transcriptional regulator n=1 Tax=Acetobacter sp. TaxID=440 RepID=UPI0039ECC9CB
MKKGLQGTIRPRLRVGFILAEHFTLSAFALFVDHLRLAADKDDHSRPIHCSWQVLSDSVHPVHASCGVTVARDAPLGNPGHFDYIVVVGGLLQGHAQINAVTLKWLQRAASLGVTLIGVCTGTFILCRAGLMDNRRVCVSWYHRHDFMAEFPDHDVLSDQRFLDDGDRITCSGGSAAADVALHLINRSIGQSTAEKARHILLMDRVFSTRAQVSLQPIPPVPGIADRIVDQRVQRALLSMEQNMSRPLPIRQLAAQLGISSRQLERLFHNAVGRKPQDVYRMIRLSYARALLEAGEMNVTKAAIETGFSDSSHFSRHFKSIYGVAPSIWQRGGMAGQAGGMTATPASSHAGVRIFSRP